jgi:adenylate kinase
MTTNIKSKTQEFESCFAVGLDLSEFASSDVKSSQISAAAELLEVKNREKIRKELEEQEEKIMQENAAQKVKEAERRVLDASKHIDIIKSCGGGSGFSSNVLVDMHSSDLSGGKKETGKNKKVVKKATNYKIKGTNVKRMRKR